jgi:hypothetical protein
MNPGMRLCLTSFQESTIHMARARRGKFPKSVMLAAPHTNEHPTVLLPQTSLQMSLEKNGVEVKPMNRFGMMAKLWKLRTMLDKEFPGNSRDALVRDMVTAILSTRDFNLRLQAMADFFRKNPEGVFMELHAMSNEVILNSFSLSRQELRDFLQISGTNMLICRGALRSTGEAVAHAKKNETEVYSSIQDQILPQHQAAVKELILRIKSRIEEFCGFSASKAAEESEANLSELNDKGDRIFIVEIPSEGKILPPTHFMHSSYFESRHPEQGYRILSPSHFEEAYAAYTRELISFSPKDSEALLNQLKVC